MARPIHRLSPLAITKQKRPGTYADGGGLWLQVTKSGSKSWSFRFMLNGRAREMGLGATHTIDLSYARDHAKACRGFLLEGRDPIEERKIDRSRRVQEAAGAKTFDQCASAYIAVKRAAWSNPKHAEQWINTLKTYVSPVFGQMPIKDIDAEVIVRALSLIWSTKTETATRVRQRIEAVLDWAAVSGFRSGENPARWGGHLEHMLAKPSKIKSVENLPALPFVHIARFVVDLRKQAGIAARAFEFMILTAARTQEIRGAVWSEIDLVERSWTVPAERMKMKREHKVPLSERAVEILGEMEAHRSEKQPYLFPGGKPGKGLSDGALLALVKRMGRSDITPHGFRSTFRDWASESTNYSHEVQEMALAHTIKNKAEAAYRRGDLFEKRRLLMGDWNRYCNVAMEATH